MLHRIHILQKTAYRVLPVLLLFGIFFITHHVFAQSTGVVPTACSQGGDCSVNDFIALLINVSKWILRIMGSVALGFFVYGGFMWITAAGVRERIEKGRSILVGTTVAIIIILGAFTGVTFIGDVLGVQGDDFGKFIDDSSSDIADICRNNGDACVGGTGQKVFACENGTCSNIPLCNYWAGKGLGAPGGNAVPAGYRCADKAAGECGTSGAPITNLCPGGNNIVCCPPP